jgi:hypothetical protein
VIVDEMMVTVGKWERGGSEEVLMAVGKWSRWG